jgi:hypothetical protein
MVQASLSVISDFLAIGSNGIGAAYTRALAQAG